MPEQIHSSSLLQPLRALISLALIFHSATRLVATEWLYSFIGEENQGMRIATFIWRACHQIVAGLVMVTFSGCSIFAPSMQSQVLTDPGGQEL